MKYFKLPDLGEGLPEAEIVEWHIQEGDHVNVDQIIVSVETAKAIIEVPSPQTGKIAHLFGQAGDTIHTGEPLLEFAGVEDEDTGTVVGEIPQESTATPHTDHFIIGAAHSSLNNAHHGKATPAVRALAKRLNIDINHVIGTGKNNAITPDDIEQAAALDKAHGKAEPLKGVRKHMAKTMALSHSQVVPVTLHDDADINKWANKADITMRLVDAIASACQSVPHFNAWFDGENLSIRQHQQIDLGVAVDTEQGLFVPVLRDIGNRTLKDLRKGLDRMRSDVKNRTIPAKELQGATITLSNFGTIAGKYANPIIVPPQVAIIGAGVIYQKPVVVKGKIKVHWIMPLSITFDHRALTGGEAARFLKSLIIRLQAKTI